MQSETILTLCYAAAAGHASTAWSAETVLLAVSAELYAASLWLCYRCEKVVTGDKLLYAAFVLLILGVKARLGGLL